MDPLAALITISFFFTSFQGISNFLTPFNICDRSVHASIDGQKLETKYNTIKARYSKKYYGLGKGISALTLFANCLPLFFGTKH